MNSFLKNKIILIILILLVSMTYCVQVFGVEQTLRNKIGEMLIIGFDEENFSVNSVIADNIRKYHVGGVILFAGPGLGSKTLTQDNIKNPIQLKALTASLQSYANQNRLEGEGPLFIAIDQEGGQVTRLHHKRGFTQQDYSAKDLGQINDLKFTYNYSKSLGAYLRDLGINLNFAPVVDLAINPDNFIYKRNRCFSKEVNNVYAQSDAFIRGMQENSIITTLKHFPGHGSSLADTHNGVADVSHTWMRSELEPYEKFINYGYSDMVMISHVINCKLDPDFYVENKIGQSTLAPATFSKKMVTDLLRNELGFQGVIITDDLSMGAIEDQYSFEKALKYSINAGVNMIILANHQEDQTAEAIEIIVRLVNSGEIPLERIEDSYDRIIYLKKSLE